MKASLPKTLDYNTEASPTAAVRLGIAKGIAAALVGGLVSLAVGASDASAGTLYNGWNYAIDSFSDGSGGARYEERGLAFRQDGSIGYFAITGGMPLAGVSDGNARNGNIARGDLFLNFSSHNLDTQADFTDAQRVFGIRFASTNDSLGNVNGNNPYLGLLGDLQVISYTTQNVGHASLQDYWNRGFSKPAQMGDLNTKTAVKDYLGNSTMYPNISGGIYLAPISLLSEAQLSAPDLGLDFAHLGAAGSTTFGFSFNLSPLPSGQFTAHFFEECINDGVALQGVVPEPGTLALLGLALAGLPLGRRRQDCRAASKRQFREDASGPQWPGQVAAGRSGRCLGHAKCRS